MIRFKKKYKASSNRLTKYSLISIYFRKFEISFIAKAVGILKIFLLNSLFWQLNIKWQKLLYKIQLIIKKLSKKTVIKNFVLK